MKPESWLSNCRVKELPFHFVGSESDAVALYEQMIADLVGEGTTREGLAALRDDVDDLLARLDEADASAAALPHRREYLELVTRFLRSFLALHLELVDEVERTLGGGGGPTFAQVARAAEGSRT